MKEPAELGKAEWLSILDEAMAPLNPDAKTIAEICRLKGIGRSRARNLMDRLVRDGKARKVPTTTSDSQGRPLNTFGWILESKKK